METKNLRGEKGQAAVLITILLMFALIALTALAIDGGHLYVKRRDLQNMSDAACLAAATEFSLGGDETAAYQVAEDYISANGGTEELYAPPEGDGAGLVKGIEVSGGDVRVALQEEVDTYFTMIFNRASALVGARSRCNPTYGGWLLPIAVRRYDESQIEGEGTGTDFLANKNADSGWENHTCSGDCDYPNDSVEHEWEGRYGKMKVLHPDAYVPISGTLYAMETGAIRGDVNPKDGYHDGVLVLGEGVETNDETGPRSFMGFVLLDARNIANGPVEYYSGASKQKDTNKDISMRWFGTKYTGLVPWVGDQLAVLSGADAKFAAKEMAEHYQVGDPFVAVVYSGYVWDSPDFWISLTPKVNATEPITPTADSPAVYTAALTKEGPAAWPNSLNVTLSVEFLSQGITPTVWITPTSMILTEAGGTAEMTIHDTLTDTHYVSAFTVKAYDSILGLKRWDSASFRYGHIATPDFTLYSGRPEYRAEPGQSLTIPLLTLGFGGGPPKNNVNIQGEVAGGPPEFCSAGTINLKGGKISILDGQVVSGSFSLKVSDQVHPPGDDLTCVIRLTVDGGPQFPVVRSVDVDLRLVPYVPGEAPLKKFVIVEGFAPFQISYIDTNTVAAFAIGPITQTPPEILAYQNPRLVSWAP